MKVAIIGAGAAGLGIGWRLARAGVDTVAIDRGAAGAGATWAAAGMLTCSTESIEGPMAEVSQTAQLLWPVFKAELEAASGVDLNYSAHGAICVAHDEANLKNLRARVATHKLHGVPVEWLDARPDFIRDGALAMAFYPRDAQVENRRLGPALAEAFRESGGVLKLGQAVTRVVTDGKRVIGVETEGETIGADVVVLAAGAWSACIAGIPDEARPHVIPKKGQIVALQTPSHKWHFPQIVGGPHAYCVPRADGRVVVGATVEDCGFNASVNQAAVEALAADARAMLTDARNWPVVEAWAGLRPGTPDDLPILGQTPVDGLILATGQYRNGVLLTPWIADTISLLIMSGVTPTAIKPFALSRFNQLRMAQ
jgi:glycine oxidase